jgi:hypothetical protein
MGTPTYLVRRGADAEDEPRGEVGPGDVRGGVPRRRPDPERGQEKENSTAERLRHHMVQRTGWPQRVVSFLLAGRPCSRGAVFIYSSVFECGPGPGGGPSLGTAEAGACAVQVAPPVSSRDRQEASSVGRF